MREHKIKSAAAQKLRDLLGSAIVHAPKSQRARTFALLCGVRGGSSLRLGGGGSTPQRRGSAAQQDEGVLKFLSSSGSALLAAEFSEQRTAFFFELLRGLFAPRRSHAAEQESLVRRLSLPDGQLLLPNYPAMPVTRLVCSQQALAESSDALAEFIESISSPHLLGGKPRGAQVDIDQLAGVRGAQMRVLDVALSAFSQAAQEIRALLLRTFYTFDTNRDGVLSIAEFGEVLLLRGSAAPLPPPPPPHTHTLLLTRHGVFSIAEFGQVSVGSVLVLVIRIAR
ncbi:hypothetical protein T492DRAFT_847824 [Pavlovales sp. CCMP2436]|nr:hypothetical protein T492DRAFT_847824 [Pavlovales sp. CCMP2436]